MVKMVLELLKMEVRDDMRAAIITAIMRPRSPEKEELQVGDGVCNVYIKSKREKDGVTTEPVSHQQAEVP